MKWTLNEIYTHINSELSQSLIDVRTLTYIICKLEVSNLILKLQK